VFNDLQAKFKSTERERTKIKWPPFFFKQKVATILSFLILIMKYFKKKEAKMEVIVECPTI
jgi:hypothetical protein